MFSSGSQRHHWTFASEEEIKKLRFNANASYINKVESSTEESKRCFLISEEEIIIVRYYEKMLTNFLNRFTPKQEPLPKDVKGTAFHFFKRFYVVSSVMDYHPKEMMITCVFLACKVCEYHMPAEMFVRSIVGNPRLIMNIIMDQEMELLYRIKFQLNIHMPYRAIDGLLLDLRTRSNLRQPERLQEHIRRFLSAMWYTDVCLLHPPALIALAAVMHATSRCKENIDSFVVKTLLNQPSPERLTHIIDAVRKIRKMVMMENVNPPPELIHQLESRLALCRNPRNNPNHEKFKRAMMEQALEAYSQ